MLHLVKQGYRGSPVSSDLRLAPGETLFYKVNSADLLEERTGRDHDHSRSPTVSARGVSARGVSARGVSVVAGSAGGRSVRVRSRAGRRPYGQGKEALVVIATGAAIITSRRVLFQGPNQVREVLFGRLAGIRHTDSSTEFAIPGRSTPVIIRYGPQFSRPFKFRLDLALATAQGTIDDLVRRLQADLAKIDAQRPG
jgi:hypothetical protein